MTINGRELTMQVSMKPINLFNGDIQIYQSSSNRTKGPTLTVRLNMNRKPSYQVSIRGYLQLLKGKISVQAQYNIADEMVTEVSAKLFLFQVSLKQYCPYSPDLLSLASPIGCRVAATLQTSALQWIGRKVSDVLKQASDTATSFISELQRKFDSAKAALERARGVLTEKQRDLDRAKSKLQGPLDALNAAQRKVDSLCRIKTCKRHCVGCPGWDGCCTRVWGKCIGCPKWRGCCTHISDPICVGANALCRTARGVANLALEAAKAAYRVVFLPFEAAKFALEVAKTGLRAAQTPFYVANRVLEAGKATVRVGLDIAASIARSVFGQIIDIRSIGFNADFRDFANLKVDATAKVVLFRREYNLRYHSALTRAE
jgi:hypothetical protein